MISLCALPRQQRRRGETPVSASHGRYDLPLTAAGCRRLISNVVRALRRAGGPNGLGREGSAASRRRGATASNGPTVHHRADAAQMTRCSRLERRRGATAAETSPSSRLHAARIALSGEPFLQLATALSCLLLTQSELYVARMTMQSSALNPSRIAAAAGYLLSLPILRMADGSCIPEHTIALLRFRRHRNATALPTTNAPSTKPAPHANADPVLTQTGSLSVHPSHGGWKPLDPASRVPACTPVGWHLTTNVLVSRLHGAWMPHSQSSLVTPSTAARCHDAVPCHARNERGPTHTDPDEATPTTAAWCPMTESIRMS